MARIIDLISDIELRLSKGVVSDDFQIEHEQIRFWLDSIRSALMDPATIKGKYGAWADFMKLVECEPINKVEKNCDSCVDKYRYTVPLPFSVVSILGDMGVVRVETQAGKALNRIRVTDLNRIKKMKFAVTENSVMWYRIGQEIVIINATDNFLSKGKLNLYLIPADSSELDENDEYPISANLVATLLDEAEKIGRRQLGMIEDIANDGKQQ